MNTALDLPTGLAYGLCALLILAVPLASAGLALVNTGFGRARSAAHSMLASMAAAATAGIVYSVWGVSRTGFAGGAAHVFTVGGRPWDWIGAGPLLLQRIPSSGAPGLMMLFQVFVVSFAAMIPVSAGAERWRLGSCCISSALFAGCTFPLLAHWVWGGGWLAQLGHNFGFGAGFVDAAGSGVAQVAGGLTALVMTWILGARRGRYTSDGMAAAIPGHNIVYVLFGALLMMPGWIGLNSAGAMLYGGASPGQIVSVAMNTALSASASALTAIVCTRIRFRRPDASLAANGWVGGLVASSAACNFVTPEVAVFIGVVAGFLVTASIEILELRLSVDDPGGAVSVHAVAGIWGLLAAGLFARVPDSFILMRRGEGASGQMLAQIVGIATLAGFVLPLTYTLNWVVDRVWPYRVEVDAERLGMDLHELGAGAYPDFSVYNDEGTRR